MAERACKRHIPPSDEPILSVLTSDGKILEVSYRTAIDYSDKMKEKARRDITINLEYPETVLGPIISYLNLKARPSLSKYVWNVNPQEESELFTSLSLVRLDYVMVAAHRLKMPKLVDYLIEQVAYVLEADEKAALESEVKKEVKTEDVNTENVNINTED